MDNLGKVTGSNLICRKEPKLIFPERERKSIKSPSDKSLYIYQLPAIYEEMQNSSKTMNRTRI